MAEEHRCQAPRLCANNCGFFGSPATQDLCSKCYRDLQLKEQQSSNAKLAFNQTLTTTQSSLSSSSVPAPGSPSVVSVLSLNPDIKISAEPKVQEETSVLVAAAAAPTVAAQPNRCSTCSKRVGLTGFKCRCGMTFCGSHRYPEQHNCDFDYKSLARDQISKANPLVKADKLDKI